MQKTLNEFAREHQEKHGYPPLIVGREYLRDDLLVTLRHVDRHSFADVQLNGEIVGVKAKSLTWIDEPEVEATTPASNDPPSREWLLRMAEKEDAAGSVSVGGLACDLGLLQSDNAKRPTPEEFVANMDDDAWAAQRLKDHGYPPLCIGLKYGWGPHGEQPVTLLDDNLHGGSTRSKGFVSVRFPGGVEGAVAVESLCWIPVDKQLGVAPAFNVTLKEPADNNDGGTAFAASVALGDMAEEIADLKRQLTQARAYAQGLGRASPERPQTYSEVAIEYNHRRALANQEPVSQVAKSPLNSDHDEARALHRVVRAMHDGECPKCHNLSTSESMRRAYANTEFTPPDPAASWYERQLGWMCPCCGFTIEPQEAQDALDEFSVFMERNLEIFEQWRAKRNASSNVQDDSSESIAVPPEVPSRPLSL